MSHLHLTRVILSCSVPNMKFCLNLFILIKKILHTFNPVSWMSTSSSSRAVVSLTPATLSSGGDFSFSQMFCSLIYYQIIVTQIIMNKVNIKLISLVFFHLVFYYSLLWFYLSPSIKSRVLYLCFPQSWNVFVCLV